MVDATRTKHRAAMTNGESKSRNKGPCKVHMYAVNVQGHRLEVQRIAPNAHKAETEPAAPVLVFLHEGLGSVSLWKKFPRKVTASTGCPAIVYSRYGSGNSDLLEMPHQVSYMHDEALKSLPELLAQLNIE